MERTEIIKALECCTTLDGCEKCPYYNKASCGANLRRDALALIKELTEENEKLTINMNAYGLTAKRLAEENERLKQLNESYAELEQGCYVTGVKKIKADTVREMQELIFKFYSSPRYQPTKEHPVKHTDIQYMFIIIERIAKEILGEKVCTDCKHFVGCECFDGKICDLYTEVKNEKD